MKRKSFEVPSSWVFLLPLMGLVQKLLVLFGWLKEGSNLNFFVLLIAPVVWVVLVLQKTNEPFSHLLRIGGMYGLYLALAEIIHWWFFREPLGLGDNNWSFDDLMHAINTLFLIPGFRFIGNIGFGLLIGVLAGGVAHLVAKARHNG